MLNLISIVFLALAIISLTIFVNFLYKGIVALKHDIQMLDFERNKIAIDVCNLKVWQKRHDTNYITVDIEKCERDANGAITIGGIKPNQQNVVKLTSSGEKTFMERVIKIDL